MQFADFVRLCPGEERFADDLWASGRCELARVGVDVHEADAGGYVERNAGAAGNTSRYRNPKLDRLFGEADAMPSGPARYKRYAEAEQIVLNDAV